MTHPSFEVNAMLTPSEVATILCVDPKTVTRWAVAGKIRCVQTPGGHRRFLRADILALATAHDASSAGATSPRPARAAGPPGIDRPEARRSQQPRRDTGRRALDAVAAPAVDVAGAAQATEAALAVVASRRAVDAAAGLAAEEARDARASRAAAAALAAQIVALSAAEATATVHRQAEASAARLKEAAARAAATVAATSLPEGDREAALSALRVAAAFHTEAASVQRDAARAAAGIATAVAAAAAAVARVVSALDVAIEKEVAELAAATRTTASATARQIAAETAAGVTNAALDREAVGSATVPDGQETAPRRRIDAP